MALSETFFGGRKLLIKRGDDYRGRPALDPQLATLGAQGNATGRTGLTKTAQRILSAQKHPAGPTLFIGNLSFETTVDALRTLLEDSARRRAADTPREDADALESARGDAGIKRIRMGTFEDTGKCKGCVTRPPLRLISASRSWTSRRRRRRRPRSSSHGTHASSAVSSCCSTLVQTQSGVAHQRRSRQTMCRARGGGQSAPRRTPTRTTLSLMQALTQTLIQALIQAPVQALTHSAHGRGGPLRGCGRVRRTPWPRGRITRLCPQRAAARLSTTKTA